MTDVIKDVVYLTMFMCSMLSPGLLNPDVSHMYDKIAPSYQVLRIKPFPNVE